MSEYRIYRNGQLLMELRSWQDRPKFEYMDFVCWERSVEAGRKYWYRFNGRTTTGVSEADVPKELKVMEVIRP